jgi:RNA polymerase II subunit A small phosphatase-like protein
MQKDKLLILDLDETLIYASETLLERPADFRVGRFYVYKRPHLAAFLEQCLSWFTVGVWTSASPAYARGIVEALFPVPSVPEFVWASDRCTRVYDTELCEYYWRKNLKKIQRKGYSRESIIVVDDTPQKWERSYGNLVRVAPFEGDSKDDELARLLVYLDHLRNEPNVRRVEKRNWRRSAASLNPG